MTSVAKLVRSIPLNGFRFATDAVTIEAASPAARLSIRATKRGVTSLSKSLGLTLPADPSKSSKKAGRHALWLGPDEWLVVDEKLAAEDLIPKRASREFSVVDVSHRNTAFIVSGDDAATALNAGCPRNLSLKAFPVGACSRTLFGKAEIILYRTGRTVFRVECWRSFAPYVRDLLCEGAKDVRN